MHVLFFYNARILGLYSQLSRRSQLAEWGNFVGSQLPGREIPPAALPTWNQGPFRICWTCPAQISVGCFCCCFMCVSVMNLSFSSKNQKMEKTARSYLRNANHCSHCVHLQFNESVRWNKKTLRGKSVIKKAWETWRYPRFPCSSAPLSHLPTVPAMTMTIWQCC